MTSEECGDGADASEKGASSGGEGLDLGVLKAPVEDFCRRSNSSCSFWGRRGGDGPVVKAKDRGVVLRKRREGRMSLRGRRRDIMFYLENACADVGLELCLVCGGKEVR